MKVIDLLVKIAKGEEVPKKIKIDNEIYVYDKKENEVWVNRIYHREHNESVTLNFQFIPSYNDEVEIIEDTPKEEIQVLSRWYPPTEDKKIAKIGKLNQVSDNKQHLNNYILRNKINEIIDKVNGK